MTIRKRHVFPAPHSSSLLTPQDVHSDESASLIDTPRSANEPVSPNAASLHDDFEQLSFTSSHSNDKKARLAYCKSHVAIHPTSFNKDNLSGYLGLVEVDASDVPRVDTDSDGNVKSTQKGKKELLVTWVPNELLERMDEADREGYKRVATGFSHGPPKEQEEDGTCAFNIYQVPKLMARIRVRLCSATERREVRVLGLGQFAV